MSETGERREAIEAYKGMLDMMSGMFVTQALHTMARLGIADLLRDGPRTAADLARAAGASERALYRVLRFLASKRVLTEDGGGRFATTALGKTFETGALGSLREMVLTTTYDDYWNAAGKLPAAVQSGSSGFREIWGEEFYAHLAANPEKAKVFQRGMAGVSGPQAVAVADAYDFTGLRRIVDVGGGSGTFLRRILAGQPAARGTLFDRPHMVETARRALDADAAVRDRVDYVGGDFFAEVPAGADTYFLANVLHNWSDADAIRILSNIRRAVAPEGRLLVVEPVIGPEADPAASEQLDVIMLAVFGEGCGERTLAEHEALLTAAGFRLGRVVQTACHVAVLEARPA
jgi:SAM-dependent methyltransferase